MQLSWKQRMAARIYKNALTTMALVSPKLAARKAFNLMCTPLSPPFTGPLPPVFQKAVVHKLAFEKYSVTGYEFRPELPNGETLLIAHGFSSYSYKFDGYIAQYLAKGYRILAFDAPGHGRSGGKYLHSLIYRNLLVAISKQYGPVHHYLGHSIAGLAGSLAVETGAFPALKTITLIAPAAEAKTAFGQFYQLVPLPQSVRTAVLDLIININTETIHWYSVNRALQNTRVPVLWIHDEHDAICPLADAQPTLDAQPQHILFCISSGLGHNRIYREGKVKKLVALFIEKGSAEAAAFVEKNFRKPY